MSIVTDSRGVTDIKDPNTCNIFALHKLFSKEILRDLSEQYRSGTISYKESKELLAENINTYFAPMRARKAELDADPAYVLQVLEEGKMKASGRAKAKMASVRKLCGFNPKSS